MKKALTILMALAMVFAAFADEPAFNAAVTKYDASAEIKYVVDLDNETTGIVNQANLAATVEISFWGAGEKATTGDGLWGELVVKGDAVNSVAAPSASINTAKIHFVDGDFAVAMNILKADLGVGGGNADLATSSQLGLPAQNVTLTGAQGFIVTIDAKDLFAANISFADNGQKKSDAKKFGFKADATIKAIAGMNIYGGFAWSQEEVAGKAQDIAYAAKFDYTLDLGGLKLIPSVGFAGKGKAKALAAAVLVNWGAVGAKPGFAKFSNDVPNVNDKCADGVSVAVTAEGEELKDFDIAVGLFDSTFVPGLTVGAEFITSTAENAGMTIDAAAKYSTTFDIFNFAANVGFKMISANSQSENGLLYGASIGTDGIIQNTTLSVAYAGEKGAKIGGADKDGTITFSAKIHF